MKYTIIFLFAGLSLFLTACLTIKDGKPSIKQGVFGRVLWVQGNVMPSPDAPNRGTGKPIEQTLHIYEITHLNEAEGQAPLFTHIKTKLIATIKTNKEGYFQCKLKPGKYSVFTVEEEGKLFANLFEGNGEINAFEVKTAQVVTFPITINYKAFY
ncbi:hypothetical protein [Pedobacter sp. Hv1]|uniref:hypothetical protein n=1 Tax=Pedobacter sp. Hv1 TaxID=1740090 RepID=UPI0006D89D5E|nr:hypothetical protein [Pedobacter sp. Hv1]KQB99986.1 hypothetical protein AQF98_15890 [Pedobacter sp. Hv1]